MLLWITTVSEESVSTIFLVTVNGVCVGFPEILLLYNVRFYPEILCIFLPLAQTEISRGILPWIIHYINVCNRIDTEDGSKICLLNFGKR